MGPRRILLNWRGRARFVGALVALLLATAAANAGADPAWISPDTTVVLGGATLDDEGVAGDDQMGPVVAWPLGALPSGADLDAFHLLPNGDSLLSLDTAVTLPGGLVAEAGDVVRWDGTTWTLEFDASSAGIPGGVVVDAATRIGGLLAVSFDSAVALGAIIVGDEDLVMVTGPSVAFDGSTAGVLDGLDLDGAHALANGNLALSFDGSGALGGIAFDDEDVLEYDPESGAWSLVYDGSALHADWQAGDVDAVHLPEPDARGGLAAGIALLLAVRRRWRTAETKRIGSRSRATRRKT